jgi:hypothetical protein
MTAIPPSLPPTGPLPQAPPSATTALLLSRLPPQLAQLAVGDVIDAAAGPPTPRGTVAIETPAGPLVLKLNFPLPAGAPLQLQVLSLGPQPLLRLLTVNGQPVAAGSVTTPPGSVSSPPPATVATPPSSIATEAPVAAPAVAATPAASGSAAAPTGIAATVVRAIAPPGPGAPVLAPGNTLTLRILSLSPPAMPQAASPADGPASPPAPQDGANSGGPVAPIADLFPSADLPAGGEAGPAGAPAPTEEPVSPTFSPPANPVGPAPSPAPQGRSTLAGPLAPIADLFPSADLPAGGEAGPAGAPAPTEEPSSPTFSPPANPVGAAPSPASEAATDSAAPTATAPLQASDLRGTTLVGTVAANSHAGWPLVQIGTGIIALKVGGLLPGSRIELSIVDVDAADSWPADALSAPPGPASGSVAALDGLIEQILALFDQSDPQAVQQMAQRLPTPGPHLAMALIAFTAGVNAGDPRLWLGEAVVKALERSGHHELVEELEQQLGGLSTPAHLPIAGDWQSLVLPLFLGQRIELIRLTMRRPPRDDAAAAARDEEGARFLVDMEMSRLGPLQLDGLVKRRAKRFDLILRSRRALPEDMRRQITAIFSRALDGLDMSGAASFQQAAHFLRPAPLGSESKAGLLI